MQKLVNTYDNMYICNMEKKIIIQQQNIRLHVGDRTNQLLLIFFEEDGNIIDTCIVPFPQWIRHNDVEYKYYSLNLN